MSTAVIFDLDGTLLDTLRDLADATNAALIELGFQSQPLAAYRELVGSGMTELMRRALPEQTRDEATVTAGVAALKRHYAQSWARFTAPYPGILQMLDELASRGVKLAVVSNKDDELVQQIVRHFFASSPFCVVVGSRPGQPNKPDPTATRQVVASLETDPSRALFVGDTGIDMQTAIAASMVPIGVAWGFRSVEELTRHGARQVIHAPHEIVPLLIDLSAK